MNLTSDHPYWSLKNGILADYPPLTRDDACDVVILGAGITGALVGEALTADGLDVVLVDARDVGRGSTSASTAMLQYEIDTHLTELTEMHGREIAETAYRACHESIDLLEGMIRRLGISCGFVRKESVYLASREDDWSGMVAEAERRCGIGINVEVWSGEDVAERLGLAAPGALCSTQAAQVDAYRLAHGILKEILRRGGRVYDRTKVEDFDINGRSVTLRTSRGTIIRARRMVVASGYETLEQFKLLDRVNLNSSFAIASEPLPPENFWWRGCLIWESFRPYTYIRTDGDRAIVGGGDVRFRNAAARDALVEKKARVLEKRFHDMFPGTGMETAFAWAGTFAETKDGLAYIGKHPDYPGCHFALGFGGNGITFSVTAAEILREELAGRRHPYARAFRLDR